MADNFRWQRYQIEADFGSPKPFQGIRLVHPSLESIDAWISALGAAITVSDLDGDGVYNELIHSEPRTDQLYVFRPEFCSGTEVFESFSLVPNEFNLNLSYGIDQKLRTAAVAPMGCLAGDFNRDGHQDLITYYWGRSPIVFMRRPAVPLASGSDAFEAVELLRRPEIWHTSAATQADFDGDGVVDLAIGNFFGNHAPVLADDPAHPPENLVRSHLPGGPEIDNDPRRIPQMQQSKAQALNGGDIHLFRGLGDGSFERLGNSAISRRLQNQWVLAIGAGDLDQDGLVDLYVANDFGPDLLLSNRSDSPGSISFVACEGSRRFETPRSCVVGRDSFKGMGVDFADLNGDSHLDILVSNIAAPDALQEGHFAWIHTGDLTSMKNGIAPFSHEAESLGLAHMGNWGWDVKTADFDNDGRDEIIRACGFVRGSKGGWASLHSVAIMSERALAGASHWAPMRRGIDISGQDFNAFGVAGPDGRYWDLNHSLLNQGSGGAPFPEPMVSRGIAISDLDGDGRVDMVVANQWGPSWILRNLSPRAEGNRNSHLALLVRDHLGPSIYSSRDIATPAIGALVTVKYEQDGETVAKTSLVDGGNGHSGQDSPEVYFGLGDASPSTECHVTIQWGRSPTEESRPREWTFTIPLGEGRHTVDLLENNQVTVLPRKHPIEVTQR